MIRAKALSRAPALFATLEMWATHRGRRVNDGQPSGAKAPILENVGGTAKEAAEKLNLPRKSDHWG